MPVTAQDYRGAGTQYRAGPREVCPTRRMRLPAMRSGYAAGGYAAAIRGTVIGLWLLWLWLSVWYGPGVGITSEAAGSTVAAGGKLLKRSN